MSENTATAAKVAESAEKAPAKRAPAKKAATVTDLASKAKPATPAEKAAAPAKATTKTATKDAPKFPFSATSRSGKVSTRQSATVMTHAVDVADPEHPKEANRTGLIWQFFPNEEKAKAWAAKKNEEGYDAKVVKAVASN